MTERSRFSRWRPHPWHGLEAGDDPPRLVQAYIEITPFDVIKYEIDKATGYLRVDRPQRYSSLPPTLYGFIPRTYCGKLVGELAGTAAGDGDPLDICVISERPINRSEVILNARVIGGLQLIDNNEADDKIVAVLANDHLWDSANDIADLPNVLVTSHAISHSEKENERLTALFCSILRAYLAGDPIPNLVDKRLGYSY